MKLDKYFNKKLKRILIVIISILLINFLVIMPTVTVIVYESVFCSRIETERAFDPSQFEGLSVKASDFTSGDVKLAGYEYSCADSPKGLVVFAHGMGGGGHNCYLPVIYSLASEGYTVFAYDSCGNGESGGEDTRGFPQGIIDLDNALCYVRTQGSYNDLPLFLFGHSFGAYSVGNVLALHPNVRAAVMVAGFDDSEDMLLCYAKRYVGLLAKGGLPYVRLYEKLKFGSTYTSTSACSSLKTCDTRMLIAHSKDDTNVPTSCGYDKLYAEFSSDERFEFLLCDDRGHTDILFSDSTRQKADGELMNKVFEVYQKAAAD